MITNSRRNRTRKRAALAAGVAAVAALAAATGTAQAAVNPGYHQLVNQQSWECLTAPPNFYNGTEVRIGPCTGLPWTRWQPIPSGRAGHVLLQVEFSKKCLKVQGSTNGANLVQDVCRDEPQQQWLVVENAGGWSRIRSGASSSRCLDKWWGDVTIWDCQSVAWQAWNSLG